MNTIILFRDLGVWTRAGERSWGKAFPTRNSRFVRAGLGAGNKHILTAFHLEPN